MPTASGVPVAKVQRVALAVDPLPDDGVRQPAVLEMLFGVEVRLHHSRFAVICEHERGVIDVLDADALRCLDGRDVTLDSEFVGDGGVGDDEEFVAALEGAVERVWLGEVAMADLEAGLDEFGRGTG